MEVMRQGKNVGCLNQSMNPDMETIQMKTYKLPKELTLNYRNWICGAPHRNDDKNTCHGVGETSLLNEDNFMCCLGQFSCQAGIDKSHLKYNSVPQDLIYDDSDEVTIVEVLCNKQTRKDTRLANRAMGINDSDKLTISDKVIKLRKLFKQCGRTINLKNFPKRIMEEIEAKEVK